MSIVAWLLLFNYLAISSMTNFLENLLIFGHSYAELKTSTFTLKINERVMRFPLTKNDVYRNKVQTELFIVVV